ncbi:hypothetical protein OESDEN_10204 [Oesophagostomum dentatum]|uniref:Uncharacterized protein n=1 Tax=Oesophagostomum dentatum TaxID=61180 RepID=A0A0B1SY97_OESDE|nr:hypothetical protein OESDEN_10204 [Oesophagostomum dentatum]
MKCKFVGTLRRMTTVYGSDKPRKNTLRSQVTSGTANSSPGPNVMRKQTIQILNPQEYKRYYAPPNGSEKYMRNFNKKNGGWGQRVPINFANDRRAEQRLEYVQNPGNSVSFPSNGQQAITMGNRQGYSNQNQLSFYQYSAPLARTNSIILTDNNAYSQQSYGQPHYHNSAAVMYLTK